MSLSISLVVDASSGAGAGAGAGAGLPVADLTATLETVAAADADRVEVLVLTGHLLPADLAGVGPLVRVPAGSEGLNAALRQAHGDLVAIVSAGVMLPPNWFRLAAARFGDGRTAISGRCGPDGAYQAFDRDGELHEFATDPGLLACPGGAFAPALEPDGLVVRADAARHVGGLDLDLPAPWRPAALAFVLMDQGWAVHAAAAPVAYRDRAHSDRRPRIDPDEVPDVPDGDRPLRPWHAPDRDAQWFHPSAVPDALHLGYGLTEYSPGPVNGIARATESQCRALAAAGHFVEVVVPTSDEPFLARQDGVWVHRLPITGHPPDGTLGVPMPTRNWDESASIRDGLRACHARDPFDVVQGANWAGEGAALIADPDLPSVLTLVTPLGTLKAVDQNMQGPEVDALVEVERWCYLHADAFQTSGPAILDEIEEQYDLTMDRSRVGMVMYGLPDARGTATPVPGPGRVNILYVGRLEARKGVDTLLDAAALVLDQEPDTGFVLIGDDTIPAPGGSTFRARFEAAHPDLADRVRFAGRASEEELIGSYAACDVFVAPSRFESFGLIALEAMMHDKPVVVGDVGGLRYSVEHEVNGLRVPPGDPQALADGLLRLVRDPQLRARLGEQARRRYEADFTPPAMAAGLERFYRSIRDDLGPRRTT